jgi:hypothetical protein
MLSIKVCSFVDGSISVDENEELLKKGSKPVLLIESKGHALQFSLTAFDCDSPQ